MTPKPNAFGFIEIRNQPSAEESAFVDSLRNAGLNATPLSEAFPAVHVTPETYQWLEDHADDFAIGNDSE